MQAFEISINGEELCLAGIDNDGVLTTIVHYAARQREGGIFIEVGGMISKTKEHVKWIDEKRLNVGDTVEIKIIETAAVDTPIKKYRLDPIS